MAKKSPSLDPQKDFNTEQTFKNTMINLLFGFIKQEPHKKREI